MPFKTKTPPRDKMRCPICSFLFRCDHAPVPANFRDDHRLEVLIQSFGGYKKVSWASRPMLRDELLAMRSLLTKILDRVDSELEERPDCQS